MSGSEGQNQRIPPRKQSTSMLLSAFARLTSSNRKSDSQSSILSASESSTSLVPSGSGGHTKLVHRSAQRLLDTAQDGIASDGQSPHNPSRDVVLSPSELLVHQLGPGNQLPKRISAVEKLCERLHDSSVKDAAAIWVVGRDLLQSPSTDAARSAYKLLIACIKASPLSAAERTLFYQALVYNTGSDQLDLRLHALTLLIDHGRNLEAVDDQIAPLVSDLLALAHQSATALRSKLVTSHGEPQTSSEQLLARTFLLTSDVIKFHPLLLNDGDLRCIISRLVSICSITTTQHDISRVFDIITKILVLTNIPQSTFQPCLDLLCCIFGQLISLRNDTWLVFKCIFASHLKNSVIHQLHELLITAPAKSMTIHGAFLVLRDLLYNDGKANMPNISLSFLVSTISRMLQRHVSPRLEADVLRFYQTILTDVASRDRLLNDMDWTHLHHSLLQFVTLVHPTEHSDSQPVPIDLPFTLTTKPADPQRTESIQLLSAVVENVSDAFDRLNTLHQEEAVSLFLLFGHTLTNNTAHVLLDYLATRSFLASRSKDNYQKILEHVILTFAHDMLRPISLREKTYGYLSSRFEEIQYFPLPVVDRLVTLILEKIDQELDPTIVELLATFAGKALLSVHGDALSALVISRLEYATFSRHVDTVSTSSSTRPSTTRHSAGRLIESSLCRILVLEIVRLFLVLMNESADIANSLYNLIQKIAKDNDLAADARISALKLLFRLRATSKNQVYVVADSESETIAAVLCRTVDTATLSYTTEETYDSHLHSFNTSSITTVSQPLRVKSMNAKKRVLPLWFYPGLKGLPQKPSKSASLVIYSAFPEEPVSNQVAVIKLSLWLETIISILQRTDVDWEVYSYVLVHLGAQLKNQSLFTQAIPQVKFLRSVLCEQIRSQSFRDPPSHTSLRKADVAICIFHNLTMLISYKAHFAKSEDDEIVKQFTSGIGSWDGTSKWCIHALSICCHELPQSIDPLLELVLQKMSQVITQPQIAIHILEFLCSLARLPELYKHFREVEFKLVFGVSFRYLQYVRDQRQKEEERTTRPSPPAARAKRHSDSLRRLKQLMAEPDSSSNTRSDEFSQYVYALAYHVITFWFMALKLQDRPAYLSWVAKNLIFLDNAGKEVIEEQGLVTLDMMERVAYTDRDETKNNDKFVSEMDGELSEKTWIVGLSLLTIRTAGRTGASLIVRRRPSGTKYIFYRPLLTMPPRHQVPMTIGLGAETFYTSAYVGVLPEDILQELYSGLSLATAPKPLSEVPVLLPSNDDKIRRAIETFDRNPTVDGHKIGILYLSEGQSTELEVLANSSGSSAYTEFITQLGTLVRLKGATFNTQGLDRDDDTDGMYTYCWRDRAIEVVFHVTTMMPDTSQDSGGSQHSNKKKHIGNDFVNIIWNDSGNIYDINTISSQFNFVNIVITPEIKTSFTDQRQLVVDSTQTQPSLIDAEPFHSYSANAKLIYKVQVISRPGFPLISPAAEPKLVTARSLAPFIRLLALNASFFCLVWDQRQGREYISPWRNRLREINRLRERYAADLNSNTASSSTGLQHLVLGGLPPTTPSSRHSHRTSFLGGLNDAP